MKTYTIILSGLMVFSLVCFGRKVTTGKDWVSPRYTDVAEKDVHLKRLPSLVVFEKEGRSEGVSAAYGGVLGETIVVAGGCNFPEKPAAEGGPKVYYDRIYILQRPETSGAVWKEAGHLPEKAANGVSFTLPQGIVCIGGVNAGGALNQAWLLKWNKDSSAVMAEHLPSLPVAMDNLTGASDGTTIYVSGGNVNGKPGNRCFVLHGLTSSAWVEIPSYPGPSRLQPVGAVAGGKYYIMGGFQPAGKGEECIVSTNGVCYDPAYQRWTFVSEIFPKGELQPRALVGASGVLLDSMTIVFQGGVNLSVFKAAVDNPVLQERALKMRQDSILANLKREQAIYMKHKPAWYRFNRQLLLYNIKTDTWEAAGDFRELAKAGAVMVKYKDKLVMVNGESKPGIRSAGVYMISIGSDKNK